VALPDHDTTNPAAPPPVGNGRVGLVLGGGGVAGLAYHAGALTALEIDLGWDARTADVIVGTSAGAIVGGLLRRGVPASDLAAAMMGAGRTGSAAALTAAFDGAGRLRRPVSDVRLNRLRPPGPAQLAGWMQRPWLFDPLAATLDVLLPETDEVVRRRAQLDVALGDRWPAADLWICAARRIGLRRVVFGLDRRASLRAAVAASCALPALVQPVLINGTGYIDGGLRSPTNADVLLRADIDVAVILSPLSATDPDPATAAGWIRHYARRRLDAEIERLAEVMPTVVLQPGAELAGFVGTRFMDSTLARPLVTRSFLDAGRQLRDPGVRSALATTGRGPGRRTAERAPAEARSATSRLQGGGPAGRL
jgi:NTE family protein